MHPLHKKIGNIIRDLNLPGVIYSPECAGKKGHNIPLFRSKRKSSANEYSNVDLLILKEDKIRAIIEIEESGFTPIKIFGKFLASAVASNYIYKEINAEMADNVCFIQIIDIRGLKPKSRKPKQYENIENSIKNILPLKNSKIKKYKLFRWNSMASGNIENEFIKYLRKL